MLETDALVIRRIRDGFIEEYAQLVHRYEKQVFGIAYRLLGDADEASDVTQETFVKAYMKLDSFDETRPLLPWLAAIAANQARNARSGKWFKRKTLDTELQDTVSPFESVYVMDELQSVLAKLSKHQREVIVLRHVAQLTYKEIAETLGEEESTVKSRLYEARNKIKLLRDREEANL